MGYLSLHPGWALEGDKGLHAHRPRNVELQVYTIEFKMLGCVCSVGFKLPSLQAQHPIEIVFLASELLF